MGLFDATTRSTLREHGDIYREKADRLAEETRLLFTGGRLADAEERVRELINYQAKVVGERHPEYASGLCMLAEILSEQDELSDAETLLQRALEIRKKALGERHPEYASALDQMGRLMLRWEDYAGAEPLLVKALEVRRAALGEDHPEYAESLVVLALVLHKRDDLEPAERHLGNALTIQRRAHGESHPDIAATLAHLSDVLVSRGRIDDAEARLRQSVEIYRQELGETHADHMAALTSLAMLLQRKGDLDAAEPIWRILLDMKRQARGAHLSDIASIQTHLGQLLQRRGDLKEAESLHRQALESSRSTLGERHPDYAANLTNLALLLQRTDDLAGAETLLRQALAIRKEVLGPRHPEYATSLVNLAQVVQKRGDTTWARMLLRDAVEGRRAAFGEQHPDFAQALAALADVYAQQGELKQALALLQQSLEVRRRTLGENHPVVAANLSNLAGVLRKLGNLDDAESALRQALQIRKVTVGEDHPDYATNLGNLAWLLQRKGDRAGAEDLLGQSLQIRRRLLGEEHPEYRQSLERLESLRKGISGPPPAPPDLAPAAAVEGETGQHGPPACTGPDEFLVTCLANADRAGEDSPAGDTPADEPGPRSQERHDESPAVPDDVPGQTSETVEFEPAPAPAPAPALFESFRGVECVATDHEFLETIAETFLSGRLDLTALDSVAQVVPSGLDPVVSVPERWKVPDALATGREPIPSESTVRPEYPGPDSMLMPGARGAEGAEPERSLAMSQTSCPPESGVALDVETGPARSLPMSESSSDLSQELAAMSDRFSDLGERLLTAARQLHAPGTPPPDDLLEALTACRQEFQSLRGRSCDLAGSLFMTCPPPEELTNLQDLTGLLDQIAEVEIRQSKSEEQRRRSLSVLDRILTLSHSSNPDFAPLREAQDKARELRYGIAEGNWMTLPSEAERLAEGQHHFADLLSLIEDRDELHDDHWATLHESVGQNFGKALAAAAARSKLVLPQNPGGSDNHH